ncbi:MAG: NAD(+) synthase [Oscillospiraceae bacterium]|nr:NAD(+) synthase [Oscillospiraceae bacterium]
MRDYNEETSKRVQFIRDILSESGANGIVFGNSGGKDAALVGILCKLACDNTLGMILPCGSDRNYLGDKNDAITVAEQYKIESRMVDLKAVLDAMKFALSDAVEITEPAEVNIIPRLRMTTLYAVAASEGRLVAGTGNRSERYVGYFTKWGDGAFDFNPIADLTVTEVYAFLEHLNVPRAIIEKAPSAGLFDGQTDEDEMGVAYKRIDEFILMGKCQEADAKVISRLHSATEHKRRASRIYEEV